MQQNSRRTFLKKISLAGLATTYLPLLDVEAITTTLKEDHLIFLFQGDSITDGNRGRNNDPNHIMGHGYAFSIASRLGADFPEKHFSFYNRGISGNKITDLEARWQKDVLDLKPGVLSILVGVNDVDSVKSPIVDSTVAYSAGSIYSTTGDLFKWHKALQNYSILSKPLQEKAYTVVKNNYGYGWVIDSVQSKRRVAHSGGIHGFTSNFTRIPEEDIVIILLSNNASPSLYEMSNKIISAFYNKPYDLPSVRKAVLLGDEKLKDYVGEYEINPQLQLKLSIKDGQLWAEPTGQKATTVYAEKEDVFYAKSPDVQLQFKRNDKKEVTGFTLHQNGQTVECRKIK